MTTPMMEQYHSIKETHPDSVLFFRMGDFYELFEGDAEIAAPILGLTLTTRDKGSSNPMPMAGFPWHSLDQYLQGMISAGHKVVVAEQEDVLRPGAKLLERVVTRIYTPGSLIEDSLLGRDGTALLASIVIAKESIGIAVIDSSVGDLWCSQRDGKKMWMGVSDDLLGWGPAELVVSSRQAENLELQKLIASIDGLSLSIHDHSRDGQKKALKDSLSVADLGHIDLDRTPLALDAAGLATHYLASRLMTDEVVLRSFKVREDEGVLLLDQTTLRNLELTQTLLFEKEGSLLHTIDVTKTSMGRRMLRNWLLRPEMNLTEIELRQGALSSFIRAPRRLGQVRDELSGLRDLERLSTRLSYGQVNARDLQAIGRSLSKLGPVQNLLASSTDPMIQSCISNIDVLAPLQSELEEALLDDLPLTVKEGNLFKSGWSNELDVHRQRVSEGRDWLSELESKERKRLDIPSLKVRFNRNFGYFIEVTKTHLDKVPEEYQRRQTMVSGERYFTEELKEWEEVILNAERRGADLEYELFIQMRTNAQQHSGEMSRIARQVARIDVLSSLAHYARQNDWQKPEMEDGRRLELIASRHPTLEKMAGFVPNDVKLDNRRRVLLVTGPNMGGKSTYLRQVALIQVLAQIGSYVPAKRARLGIVDRIFTRVGAQDDLRRGRSTFMVEMLEVAHILRQATSRSIVLLDEVGRGTSTFDGLSIAWSVVEDISQRIDSHTLFATHYHQLTGLEGQIEGLMNVHLQVAESEGELKFLHSVAEGPCDESYGVQVAALAGLPINVVERAHDLLRFLEKQAEGARAGESGQPGRRMNGQRSLFTMPISSAPKNELNAKEKEVLKRLATSNPDTLTARKALDLLYELSDMLDGEG